MYGGAALTWISPKASLSVRLSAAYTCSKDVSNCPPIILHFLLFSPRPMRTYHSAGGRKCSLVQGVQGLKTRKLLGSGIGRRRAQSTTASDRSGGTSSESQSRAGNCGGAGARCCQRRSHGAHRGSGEGGGGSHHDSTEAKVDRRGEVRVEVNWRSGMNVMLGERVKKPKKEESKGREQKEKDMKLQLKAVETKQSRHSESVCRVHPARYRHDGHYTLAVGAQCGIDVRYGMHLTRIINLPGISTSFLFLGIKLRIRDVQVCS